METLLESLTPTAKLILAMIMDGANDIFQKHGEVPPAIFVAHEDGQFDHITPNMSDKNLVAVALKGLRKEFPIVALVSEAWLVDKPSKEDEAQAATEGISNNPRRTEVVMISFYLKDRTVMLRANISRKPNKVGNFNVFSDSSAKDAPVLSGRFV